ncbi:hypothetical protein E5Q_01484 [Mixia osmundae IAM 14324]|uniref:CNH domain-containing protein n=1 Tax=Mixia osmundae (strain CBS 9802 / IAM 14324 / JCM 22182 / KY 12970) TaxID=764103 RepID=G7DW24_MIXOS|nr:hypothetical protein E5Q_01484 [Mixia osmundae IAM 14324]
MEHSKERSEDSILTFITARVAAEPIAPTIAALVNADDVIEQDPPPRNDYATYAEEVIHIASDVNLVPLRQNFAKRCLATLNPRPLWKKIARPLSSGTLVRRASLKSPKLLRARRLATEQSGDSPVTEQNRDSAHVEQPATDAASVNIDTQSVVKDTILTPSLSSASHATFASAAVLDERYLLLGSTLGLSFIALDSPIPCKPVAILRHIRVSRIVILPRASILLLAVGRPTDVRVRVYNLAEIRARIEHKLSPHLRRYTAQLLNPDRSQPRSKPVAVPVQDVQALPPVAGPVRDRQPSIAQQVHEREVARMAASALVTADDTHSLIAWANDLCRTAFGESDDPGNQRSVQRASWRNSWRRSWLGGLPLHLDPPRIATPPARRTARESTRASDVLDHEALLSMLNATPTTSIPAATVTDRARRPLPAVPDTAIAPTPSALESKTQEQRPSFELPLVDDTLSKVLFGSQSHRGLSFGREPPFVVLQDCYKVCDIVAHEDESRCFILTLGGQLGRILHTFEGTPRNPLALRRGFALPEKPITIKLLSHAVGCLEIALLYPHAVFLLDPLTMRARRLGISQQNAVVPFQNLVPVPRMPSLPSSQLSRSYAIPPTMHVQMS